MTSAPFSVSVRDRAGGTQLSWRRTTDPAGALTFRGGVVTATLRKATSQKQRFPSSGPAWDCVSVATPGPSFARRQLGRRLRRYREDAGKTHEDVAESGIAERTKMWRIEQGKVRVKPQDIMALCRLYGLDDEVEAELLRLAGATKQAITDPHGTASVPDWLGSYGELEAASSAVTAWHPELVHGLLQTPDYVRALMRAGDVTDERMIEERVSFRLDRQRAVLQGAHPTRVTAVLGAGALTLVVGSEAVMEDQVAHLRAISGEGLVDVRILPWSAGAYPSMKGSFTILDFDDPDDPALVYLEAHVVGGRYLEQRAQVEEYRRLFGLLYERAMPAEEYRA
jgi:transcriptional regulator with XRE-family HTH domain